LFYPAEAIILTVLAFTLLGEGLRRATGTGD
jgi:ABC-type dipeptide/oligopeptide/nickel transport system permease subunit